MNKRFSGRLRALLTTTLLGGWLAPAQAIVNMENMRIGPAQQGFSGSLDASASGKTGNSDKQDYSLDSRLQWQRDRVTQFIVLSYDYGISNNRRSSNSRFLHARHVFQYQPRQAWENYIQLEQNEFTRLSYRALLGSGLRLTLREVTQDVGLYLGAGAYAYREKLEQDSGLDSNQRDEALRGSFYLSYKQKFNEQVSFVSTTYLQPRLDDGSDYRALEQAALTVKMSQQLSIKLSIDITHDSRPPTAIRQTDLRYYSGIRYRF